ncbi:MAG TPA: SprT family zinc-dependent metalloprotease [Pseudobdellovibrionaceae bacterium]|nr:SprT family zinc-dependent metalloprotease [Pseudobdellovibrionaceae bacterium]
MYWIIEFGVNVLEEVFQFQNWQVKIQRKLFRRGISLSVFPDLRIQVSAGLSVSQKEVAYFLDKKTRWIQKHFQKFESKKLLIQSQIQHQTFQTGAVFPFLGKDLHFKNVPTPIDKYFISISEPYLNLHAPLTLKGTEPIIPKNNWIKDEVRRIYLRESKKILIERVQHWSKETGFNPKSLSFRTQKSRWGSCSSSGKISLNLKLIIFPIEVIDYVIVHELCHLKQMNHSSLFWQLVAKHIPHHKSMTRTLKEQQWKTHFLEV